MAALVTQAQVEKALGADVVADLTGSDADVIAELLEQASDWVQEYATAAGAPLTAGSLTAAMRRRVCIAFGYFGTSRKPEYRSTQGKPPYSEEYAVCERELKAWADRVRPISTDEPSEAPSVLSDDPRGW